MAGLTTAAAQARERTCWGTMARLAADGTLERLTGVTHTAIKIFNTKESKILLGKKDLHKPVAITYGREILKVTMF